MSVNPAVFQWLLNVKAEGFIYLTVRTIYGISGQLEAM